MRSSWHTLRGLSNYGHAYVITVTKDANCKMASLVSWKHASWEAALPWIHTEPGTYWANAAR